MKPLSKEFQEDFSNFHPVPQTAYLAATLINSNPFRKSTRTVQPHELNPYAKHEKKKEPNHYISIKTFAKAIITVRK
ncbi:MAG: hypothetical protein LBG58_00665 [Planctomycetaceae bacterium]|jgi:hypothetical protein|nr:hypothetical protein [Planctomycetaceae bacterium]